MLQAEVVYVRPGYVRLKLNKISVRSMFFAYSRDNSMPYLKFLGKLALENVYNV